MVQASLRAVTSRASNSSSEKRRLTSELAVAQKNLGDMQSRIANMNSISAKTAKTAAEERAAAEQLLVAEQQVVARLKVLSSLSAKSHIPLVIWVEKCTLIFLHNA